MLARQTQTPHSNHRNWKAVEFLFPPHSIYAKKSTPQKTTEEFNLVIPHETQVGAYLSERLLVL